MKKHFLLILSVLVLSACWAQTNPVSGIKSASEEAITKFMDNFYAAYHSKDYKKVLDFITEDCLSCGTDSKEFWDKAATSEMIKAMVADTSVHPPAFKIDKRVIKLDKEGNSAIVIEQFFVEEWSKKIPVRNVSHLVKIKGKWYLDFMSSAFIPDNEDMARIFKSVM